MSKDLLDLDEMNNPDDIVILNDGNGKEIKFIEIAGIAYKGGFYAILRPVDKLEGLADDEAIVFKVTRAPDGQDMFNVELDDNIINGVFDEYCRLLDNATNK